MFTYSIFLLPLTCYLKYNIQYVPFIHKLDNKGYYAILGVSEQAKYFEIKAAYRRLVKNYHPDVSHSNNNHSSLSNEDMIKKINAAYEVLSDKDKSICLPSILNVIVDLAMKAKSKYL